MNAEPHPPRLDHRYPEFAGRAAELAALSSALDEAEASGTAAILVIAGTAGVGKTALALHWARQVATQFPGGQLQANLRGFDPSRAPADPSEVISGFLGALGAAPEQIPADPQAQTALYRSLLAGQRVLLILDNALDEEQVRPLLPGHPGTLVVVTSRNEMKGLVPDGTVRLLTLDVLAEDEARDLLASRLGADRVAAEPGPVGDLIRRCARLPLALAIAAAQATARPQLTLAAVAAELRDSGRRLDALDPADPAANVRAVFSWSWQNLSPAGTAMFRLLGLHPGADITVPAAASLAGLPLPRAAQALGELTHSHLLTEHKPGRYTFHDLLRAYAAEQAAAMDEPSRRAALGRLLDHYLHTAHAAAVLVNTSRETIVIPPAAAGAGPERFTVDKEAMAWLKAERQVLLCAVTTAAETGFDTHAWQLAWSLTDVLDWSGQWLDLGAVCRTALAAATRLGDPAGQASIGRLVAYTLALVGDHEQARAYLTECLGLCRRAGERAVEARIYLTLGWIAERERHHVDALGYAEQALAVFRAIGDRRGEGSALNNAGYSHLQFGDRRLARTYCQQAIAIHHEAGHSHGEGIAWDSLGEIEHNFGRYAEAANCYQTALRIFTGLGARVQEAQVLLHLGDTYSATGAEGPAEDAWRQSLAIFDDLRNPAAESVRHRLARQLSVRAAQ